MRLLLDNECVAVAGGHQSACVKNVTTAAITTGAVFGVIGGGMAGGVGGVAGGIAGAGIGSLFAQVFAETLCSWAGAEEEDTHEEEREPVDPAIEDWTANQYASYNQSQTTSYNPDPYSSDQVYAPHQYVADGASY